MAESPPTRQGASSARRNQETISRSESSWAGKEGRGAQMVFSSHLPIGGEGSGRERSIWELNSWLSRCSRGTRFHFLARGLRWVLG
jgi:hypothetical protein